MYLLNNYRVWLLGLVLNPAAKRAESPPDWYVDFVRSRLVRLGRWAKRVKRSRPISPLSICREWLGLRKAFHLRISPVDVVLLYGIQQIRYKSDEQRVLSYFERYAVWPFTIQDPAVPRVALVLFEVLQSLQVQSLRFVLHSDVAN
ncbi:hypothetical protein F5Y11DRAFT_321856 [Daldinia sp. FL1419]|nr:hypothetical protein F5Y11DRAFT_321856 [Daldinia sp. FL1419]